MAPEPRTEVYLSAVSTVFSNIFRFHQLQQERDLFRAILEHAGDCIEITDEDAIIQYVNPAFEKVTGYSRQEAVGHTVADLLRPQGAGDDLYESMRRHITTGGVWRGTLESRKKDRSTWMVETTLSAIFDRKGQVCNHIAIKRDITDQINMYKQLSNSERRFHNLMDQAADAIFVHDMQGRFREVNQVACDSLGFSRDELLQMNVREIECDIGCDDLEAMWESLPLRPVTATGVHRRRDGGTFPVELRICLFDAVDEKLILAMVRDITERKRLEARLIRQANYDALTSLPNRTLASDRLQHALAMADRSKCQVAVIFLDLDGFKKVNDTLGHEAGDRLLRNTAKRLQSCIREQDTVARLGGDEFMFVLPNLDDQYGVDRVVEKLRESSSQPYFCEGQEVFVSASIGVAMYPHDGESPELLMRHADTAMYRSKKSGPNRCSFFSTQMSDSARSTIRMESALRKAIRADELEVYYQPIVNLYSNRVIGAEALLRWNDAESREFSSDQVVRIAEDTGLIDALGQRVLEKACQQTGEWNRQYGHDLCISVNVSVHQLRGGGFTDSVTEILRNTGFPAGCLRLEVIETALLENSATSLEIMNALHQLGIHWVIDDFGTGYSSLSYVRDFPFSILKIDRSFIHSLIQEQKNRKLVSAIIAMAESFEIDVIAEGVEHTHHRQVLVEMGCRFGQGWALGKPVCAGDFDQWLKEQIPIARPEDRTSSE